MSDSDIIIYTIHSLTCNVIAGISFQNTDVVTLADAFYSSGETRKSSAYNEDINSRRLIGSNGP